MRSRKDSNAGDDERTCFSIDGGLTASDRRNVCIHQLFEAQAEKTPEATALVCEHLKLTYRELNTRANRLAHYLQSLGIGPEVLVGICAERSIEMIVGLLGILKAGGAYVPLDPHYPKDRLAFMLNDTNAPVLLTHRSLLADSPPQYAGVRVCLDDELFAAQSDANLSSSATADNLAYVIYTSGSTGIPKAAMIPHRGVVRLVKNTNYADFSATHTFLQFAPISFDASTFEIWGALLNGAKLLVFPPHTPALEDLAATLIRGRITTLWLTANLFHLMVDQHLEALTHLRQLLAGGDILSVVHVRRFLAAAPACRLINGYGPTENTTFTCCYSIPRDAQITSSVPIGTPIANTQVYVLDEHGKPVSTGVPGELHAGGAGLARGYLNRPDLSAEKFIANPFSDDADSRLYKTGDLVRRLADGNIEFLGRLDDQVKIRGFRIELGEIETVLSDHPECKQAVVIAREETSGDPTASLTTGKRLVAYVVVSGERRDELIARLRDHLKARLPDHMLPSAFVLLDKLPLTANGKIDRKALPAPDQIRPDMENFVAPRDSLESTLARIYSEVLNVEHVGVHDNFMNLGGHSLFAAQIAARVREALQIELPLRLLLEGSSVSALAARIQTSESEKYAPLMRVARHGDLPVSFSQERAWFIQQLDPTSIAYNFQATLSFTGQLDSAALERSLSEIVRRHEILRTSFPEVNGRPIQLIHHSGLVSLSTIDLQTLPGSEREAAAQRIIDLEVRKHFDLAKLPLIRWVLIRLAADAHILLQIEHHLIHDGWSFHAFLGELLELYKAFIAGKPSPLAEPAIQFADFAIAQRRWMEGEEAAAQIAYWKRKLSGAAALAWRSDRPRPPQQTFVGAAPRIELPLELCESLRALSRRRAVTLFMTMFAGFLIVLQRYAAQTDICVGSGIANRRWRETEGLIGMIINNVVLRVDLSGDPDFRELLRRVQQTTLDAYANQDAPFDRVVHALGQARDASRNPLFEVMFSFHDSPLQNLNFPKLKTRLLSPLSNGSAKFDLNVIVIPHAEQRVGPASVEGDAGITLVWEYNSDLFDEATMTRMIGHYQNILHGIVTDPALRISQLPLLSHAEHQQLLTAWNATGSDYPRHRTITGLFEEQVERNPEAVAVVFEDRQLTYGELNQQANRLAHHLVALGVGPEVLVGLCVERSLEMLIALLAILKAGGAYVPIDSDHPQERLAFMLEDTQVSVLITQRHLEGRLPRRPIERIYLDDLKSVTGNHPGTDPAPRAKPDNLAYVIYTSGSTGKPKGVLISHSNVHRLFSATDAWYGFSQNDVWTLFHSYAFDFSVWEIWGALLYGGRLVIVPYETSRSPDLFYELLLEQRVTVLNQTPSAFYALIEADRAYKGDRSLDLRLVIFGGEALNFAKLSHWYLRHGECTPRLVNMYGITETTVHVTYYPITAAIAAETAGSVIGQAIPDLSLYILDPHMNPVPIGVAGELYVGGAGLARGYLNRLQLTAEKFIPNPFSDDPAERLYKTGDLVRRLADGNIEFLGRSDDQAKIRGFRIELGEIETALSNHPKIKQAVVIAREEKSGDRRLIAYVVVSGERQDKLIARLRDHLKARLPDHMLPSAFVVLDELPLTANGKVDRKALPAPNDARPELEAVYVAPRTPTEEMLTAIWAEVLKLEKIGIHDNFFDLGGHSLLATQVISRVKETLDADVQLRALFESPTVAGLAAHVAQVNEGTAAPALTSDLTALSDEALDAFILAATKP